MIKNIIIGVLSLFIVFFVVYANIKAKEAEKQVAMAQSNLELAEENAALAKAEEKKATEAAAMALVEQQKVQKLREQLEDCKK
ncbi:hypothetical protein SAMN04488029_3172 [Reichenbachiella faecimaris]|uniref:Uncharacterized protein n=1 Tax=Reichenbachiella faecimaris TaxID=692418 RepID=A0A1W2GKV6_REIFA|nr:FeoB-associated Cys-rich membrane protein [Reichenbachiella faecimaris]SMD36978.1 hypothetical protein SAMN04488029_3172 [Reichenbachiella faecimaris]